MSDHDTSPGMPDMIRSEKIPDAAHNIAGAPLRNMSNVRKELGQSKSQTHEMVSHIGKYSIQQCTKMRKNENAIRSVAVENYNGYSHNTIQNYVVRGNVNPSDGLPRTFHLKFKGVVPDSSKSWSAFKTLFFALEKQLDSSYGLSEIAHNFKDFENTPLSINRGTGSNPFIHCYSRGPPLKWEYTDSYEMMRTSGDNQKRVIFGKVRPITIIEGSANLDYGIGLTYDEWVDTNTGGTKLENRITLVFVPDNALVFSIDWALPPLSGLEYAVYDAKLHEPNSALDPKKTYVKVKANGSLKAESAGQKATLKTLQDAYNPPMTASELDAIKSMKVNLKNIVKISGKETVEGITMTKFVHGSVDFLRRVTLLHFARQVYKNIAYSMFLDWFISNNYPGELSDTDPAIFYPKFAKKIDETKASEIDNDDKIKHKDYEKYCMCLKHVSIFLSENFDIFPFSQGFARFMHIRHENQSLEDLAKLIKALGAIKGLAINYAQLFSDINRAVRHAYDTDDKLSIQNTIRSVQFLTPRSSDPVAFHDTMAREYTDPYVVTKFCAPIKIASLNTTVDVGGIKGPMNDVIRRFTPYDEKFCEETVYKPEIIQKRWQSLHQSDLMFNCAAKDRITTLPMKIKVDFDCRCIEFVGAYPSAKPQNPVTEKPDFVTRARKSREESSSTGTDLRKARDVRDSVLPESSAEPEGSAGPTDKMDDGRPALGVYNPQTDGPITRDQRMEVAFKGKFNGKWPLGLNYQADPMHIHDVMMSLLVSQLDNDSYGGFVRTLTITSNDETATVGLTTLFASAFEFVRTHEKVGSYNQTVFHEFREALVGHMRINGDSRFGYYFQGGFPNTSAFNRILPTWTGDDTQGSMMRELMAAFLNKETYADGLQRYLSGDLPQKGIDGLKRNVRGVLDQVKRTRVNAVEITRFTGYIEAKLATVSPAADGPAMQVDEGRDSSIDKYFTGTWPNHTMKDDSGLESREPITVLLKKIIKDCALSKTYIDNFAIIHRLNSTADNKTNATIALTGFMYRLFYTYRQSGSLLLDTESFDSAAARILEKMRLTDSFVSMKYVSTKINDTIASEFFNNGVFAIYSEISEEAKEDLTNLYVNLSGKDTNDEKRKLLFYALVKFHSEGKTDFNLYLNQVAQEYISKLKKRSASLPELPFLIRYHATLHFQKDSLRYLESINKGTTDTQTKEAIEETKKIITSIVEDVISGSIAYFKYQLKKYNDVTLIPSVTVGDLSFAVPRPIPVSQGLSLSIGSSFLHDVITILSVGKFNEMRPFTKFVMGSAMTLHRSESRLIGEYVDFVSKESSGLKLTTISFLLRNAVIMLKNEALYSSQNTEKYQPDTIKQFDSFITDLTAYALSIKPLHQKVFENNQIDGDIFFGDDNYINFDAKIRSNILQPQRKLVCPMQSITTGSNIINAIDETSDTQFIPLLNRFTGSATTKENYMDSIIKMARTYQTTKQPSFKGETYKLMNKFDNDVDIDREIMISNQAIVEITKKIKAKVENSTHSKKDTILSAISDIATTFQEVSAETFKTRANKRKVVDWTPKDDTTPSRQRTDEGPVETPVPLKGQFNLQWGADEYGSDVEF